MNTGMQQFILEQNIPALSVAIIERGRITSAYAGSALTANTAFPAC
jgi:hypothetical protein